MVATYNLSVGSKTIKKSCGLSQRYENLKLKGSVISHKLSTNYL